MKLTRRSPLRRRRSALDRSVNEEEKEKKKKKRKFHRFLRINIRKYYTDKIKENNVSCKCRRHTLRKLRKRNVPIREKFIQETVSKESA